MHFIVLTLFPEMFSSFLACGLLHKAFEEGRIRIEILNFRKHGIGKHLNVDAPPYGGGAGMLLRVEPIVRTLEDCQRRWEGRQLHKLLITPQGGPLTQPKVRRLAQIKEPVVLICGRFEGFDQRLRHYIDDEISLGDFILMGGEIAAMAIIESVCRLIPGVIGNPESLAQESFSHDLLEYSQFTRPVCFEGLGVPTVLRSGDHGKIAEWRRQDAIQKTKSRRRDLFQLFEERDARR